MLLGGIDYSMSCPAIVVMDTSAPNFQNCSVHYLTDTKKYAGKFENINGTMFEFDPEQQIKRFSDISDWAINIIKKCEYVIIEGYSMASKGVTYNIGENTGILKYKIYQRQLNLSTLPPTKLKKFACGKGNADKLMMYEAFIKETEIDLFKIFDCKGKKPGNPISDIVDSYFLVKYLSFNLPKES